MGTRSLRKKTENSALRECAVGQESTTEERDFMRQGKKQWGGDELKRGFTTETVEGGKIRRDQERTVATIEPG